MADRDTAGAAQEPIESYYDELADVIKPRLDLALARTDVPIHASCFCRLDHEH